MKISFLGPLGTNSHAALKEYSPQAKIVCCQSIPEVFEKVLQEEVELGFVPLENIIQGPVTATFDLLYKHKDELFIVDGHLKNIEHAVGILDGELQHVHSIYSHEQAIAQCTDFLSEKFPKAAFVYTESTGAAVQQIKKEGRSNVLVIAPKHLLEESGFRIINPNASNYSNNKTRFVIIKKGNIVRDGCLAPSVDRSKTESVTSIAINPGRDRKGLLFEILNILSVQCGVNLSSIHSRPDTRGGFVFHLDLEGVITDEKIKAALSLLQEYFLTQTGGTARVSILGSYKRVPFYPVKFNSIAVIGGNGRMGQLFRELFSSLGLVTHSVDVGSGEHLQKVCAEVDIVLLSVPMSEVENICHAITAALKPGTLVVENCSVKESALPAMLSIFSPTVEILGIHTMFGPDIKSVAGENIIITKTKHSGPKAKAFEDILYKNGANLFYASPEDHDKNAAIIQSLMHLLLIGYIETLSQEGTKLSSLKMFSTPNFRRVIDAAQRVLEQSEDLTIGIQTKNAFSPKVRNTFLQTVLELVTSLNEKDSNRLREAIAKGKIFLANHS